MNGTSQIALLKRMRGLLLFAVLFLLGSGGTARGQDNWEAYRAAVKDAAIYNRRKVLPLHPLQADGGKVRVVTYTRFSYPDPPYPKPYHIPEGVFVWVTADGEVQSACRQFRVAGDQLRLRLNQMLGLKPDTNYTTFVVLSAPADRVFRPTPDPNPTRVFPCADAADNQCGNKFPPGVPASHMGWLAQQSLASYRIGQEPAEDGFPWTHLGYTYDWAPYAASKYGASEYVIMENSDVTILDKIPMSQYCGSQSLRGGGPLHSKEVEDEICSDHAGPGCSQCGRGEADGDDRRERSRDGWGDLGQGSSRDQ